MKTELSDQNQIIYENSIFFSGVQEDHKKTKIQIFDMNQDKFIENKISNQHKKKID